MAISVASGCGSSGGGPGEKDAAPADATSSGSGSGGSSGSASSSGGGPDATTTCGASGDLCCNGTACNAGLTCLAGSCQAPGVGLDSGSSSGGDSSVDDSSSGSSGGPDGGSSGSIGTEGGSPPACDGGSAAWRCKVDTSCASPTTLTGRVYDPAGKNPLYNVIVFIPNDPAALPRISPGTHSCNTCDAPIGDQIPRRDDHRLPRILHVDGRPSRYRSSGHRAARKVAAHHVRRRRKRLRNEHGRGQVPAPAGQQGRRRHAADGPPLPRGGYGEDMGCFMMNIGIASSEFGPPLRRGTRRRLPGQQHAARPGRCRAGAVERHCRELHQHELPALVEQGEPRVLR